MATASNDIAQTHANEVAVITGGARGIGFAVAERLGREGATVVLVDLLKDVLEESVKKLEQKGITASSQVVDVADEKSVTEAFQAIVQKHKKVDILVQCAGITGKTKIKTHEVDPADFQRVLDINLKGIFLCCRAVLPTMVEQNYGRIVNVASIAGKEGNAGMLAYSTSKAGVIGLTKVIGKEYADTNITCNAIAPAVVRTQMVEDMPDEQVKYMTDKIPMKRCGRLEEIAAMISFMASKESSFTTGFTFDATGGRATY